METKESCLSHIAQLRADMIQKDWIIDAFRVILHKIECVVVMEIYCEQNPRPKEKERFVVCTLHFHDAEPARKPRPDVVVRG